MKQPSLNSPELRTAAAELSSALDYGRQQGWFPGSSGSMSIRLPKSQTQWLTNIKPSLQQTDSPWCVVDQSTISDPASRAVASRWFVVHDAVYQFFPSAVAIIQTHQRWSMQIAKRFITAGGILIENLQVLEALEGQPQDAPPSLWLPIFAYPAKLSAAINDLKAAWQTEEPPAAFLIEDVGLFSWSDSMSRAVRQTEAIEFACELVARQILIS
jgi:methylthioribulose-1-phosphate dehydratase